MSWTILQADARQIPLADSSVQCVVTSPPYWGLRDYGTARWEGGDGGCDHVGPPMRTNNKPTDSTATFHGGITRANEPWKNGNCGKCGAIRIDSQIGLEKTPQEYVDKIVALFREVWRVLRDDGVAFINLGDSYSGSWGNYHPNSPQGKHGQRLKETARWNRPAYSSQEFLPPTANCGLKPKDLVGIPWRVAFALQQPYIVPTCVKSDIDRAWLAAMFDGEGCIGIRRFDSYRKEKQQVYQDGFVVYTVVTNNDIELLDHCVRLTGKGKPHLKQAADSTDDRGIVSRRDSYGWRLDGNGAVDVIRAVYPYLIAKRKQACLAFTLDQLNKNGHGSRAVPQEIQEKKRLLWELIKRCNQRESVDIPSWVEEPKQKIEPGWYLRSDIIWSKPNPMPESVTDRPTKAHEYIFLLSKQERYFWDQDAVREPNLNASIERYKDKSGLTIPQAWKLNQTPMNGGKKDNWNLNEAGRNIRTVWAIATQPYAEAHFATFPEELAERCIKAGTSEKGCCAKCGKARERVTEQTGKYQAQWAPGAQFKQSQLGKGRTSSGGVMETGFVKTYSTLGWQPSCSCDAPTVPCVVLDPFAGAGTTCLVADKLNRNGIGLELKNSYCDMAKKRIFDDAPLLSLLS